MKAILTKGSGYWNTGDGYGYGMSFRRASQDMEVEVTGQKVKNDLEFTFVFKGKKGTGYSSVLMNPEGGSFLL